ncbi:heat shock 70 kDa protein 12B [Brachyhypopomus gauderio]|uniref:heat shock 70 kDa protein 12B n=1 Tax=Brachyhypopomus gauderio TaxID=698409 RepID=UPI0040432149
MLSPSPGDPVHELWLRCSVGLSASQGELLSELLNRYRGLFAVSERDCSRTGLASHAIDTGDAKPVRLRPHRLPLTKRVAAERQIREMAAAGVIEPSNSSWSAPVVLAKKKDGSWRFCVDYRRLNAVTKLDSYPMPRVDDTLERLAGSDWFSSLDLRSGYWQVPLDESAKEKTAFSIGAGLWHFKVLPFGLCNAPATFERLMERVLSGVPSSKCVVYLDDVLVHATGFESALANLELVLGLVKEANLSLNPAKCNLLQRRINFLGHVVSGEGIATDPGKTAAVREWPTPRTVRQVRSFLGLASYYRRFVKGFADIAAPLHHLTRGGGTRFSWPDDAECAFRTLKQRLCSAPVLAYPSPTERFIVDTDASDHGLGAVLSQVQEGSERAIAYFSRRLDKAEKNYCVTRRELLAVVEGLWHFRPYVYGVPFLLRTDHASLQWLLNFREPEGQLARWLARLQEFNFVVEHRPGRIHGNADALSRRPCASHDCKHCQRAEGKAETVGVCAAVGRTAVAPPVSPCISTAELAAAQRADPDLAWALDALEAAAVPDWDDVVRRGPVAKALRSNWDSLRIAGGVLHRTWEDPSTGSRLTQTVVPQGLRDTVLQAVHGLPGSGHFGITKTLHRLRQRFWWPGCRAGVELFVHCCDTCAAKKGPARVSRAPLHPMQSGCPMERVAVDVLGPFPVTESGNRYVLVAMDYFTKWPEAYAVPDQSAVTTAETLLHEFFCRFGVPEVLHSDQGRNFESDVMTEVCRLLGVHRTRTTPLHPQGDGLVERFNRTLATQLAMATQENQRDWDKQLPLVLLACRSALQETTGFTPAMLMFGRELRSPVDLAFGAPPTDDVNVEPGPVFVSRLRTRLLDVHKRARGSQAGAGLRQKRAYDMRCYGGPLPVHSEVWLYNPRRKKGLCPKLQSAWVGPCTVLARVSDVVYRIRWGRRRLVVHRDRLAPYQPKVQGAGRCPDSSPPVSPVIGPAASPVAGPARPQRTRRLPRRLQDCVT